jgi:hypothetical protein
MAMIRTMETMNIILHTDVTRVQLYLARLLLSIYQWFHAFTNIPHGFVLTSYSMKHTYRHQAAVQEDSATDTGP